MEQDTNREYLKKLLDFLRERILPIPGNQWFAKELYKLLAPASDARISDIHEQCIESILTQQANEFYKDFVIADLRPQLIADFIKMEHWRRRNNIYEFSLAMYQQVECIVNYISRNNTLCEVFHTMMDCLCFVDAYPPTVDNRNPKSSYTVAQLLFMHDAPTKSKEILPSLWAYDKFKAINYFVCHQTMLTNYQFDQFVGENRIFGELYALRNRVHRGNDLTEKEIERTKQVESNPSRGFLTLTAFLTWFIDSVNKGYPLSNELVTFSKTDFSSVRKPLIGPKVVGKIDLPKTKSKRNN
ncbi:MAG: hypothetical protein PUC21_00205 [Bacteroidales bacterium]|nr:hypothetical protein [Bacteroidales bacterium]